MNHDLIGWFASLVLVITIAYQVLSQWRSGTSKGVSRWLFVGQFIASASFTVYAALVGNTVFIVTNSMLALSACVGLGVWVVHRRAGDAGTPDETDRSMHHIGIACADLDRSVRFYTQSLGASLEMRFKESSGPVAMLTLPGGCRLELFQSPSPHKTALRPPGSSDGGDAPSGSLVHFAITATDVQRLTDAIAEAGGRIVTEPQSTRLENPVGSVGPTGAEAPVARYSFLRGPSSELIEVIRLETPADARLCDPFERRAVYRRT